MDNTIQALTNLYVALGGDADDVAGISIIPDMINAIAELIGEGGGSLPAVDSEDNGKVLKVIDGEWGIGTDETTAAAATT